MAQSVDPCSFYLSNPRAPLKLKPSSDPKDMVGWLGWAKYVP